MVVYAPVARNVPTRAAQHQRALPEAAEKRGQTCPKSSSPARTMERKVRRDGRPREGLSAGLENLVVPDPGVLEQVLFLRADHSLLPAITSERPNRFHVLPDSYVNELS